MSYPRYNKYKDIGVDWLGEIPNAWGASKFKYVASIYKGQAPSELFDVKNKPNLVAYLTMDYLRDDSKDIKWTTIENKTKLARTDDVLLLWDGSNAGEFILAREGAVSSTLALIESKGFNQKFFYFMCKSFEEHIQSKTTGMGIPHVNGETLKETTIPVPPLQEQISIANFLDSKMYKIDKLIYEQKRLIDLLKEKKQGIISLAITKGFNSDSSIKSSGEKIEEVPGHWGIRRLKSIVKEPLKYGINESAVLEDRENPRFIRITDICENNYLDDSTFKSLPNDIAKPYLLEEGDVLLARSGATVGKSFIYSKNMGKACYAGYLIRVRLNLEYCLPKWFSYFCQTKNYWDYIVGNQIQATIQNVSAAKYNNLYIPLPPLEEQNAILAFLDAKTVKINSLINEVRKFMELLQESRKAIIFNAVTGKIDLRPNKKKGLK